MKPITERQQKYLVALMSNFFGNNRRIVLEEKFGVSSTKDLNIEQASDMIEILHPDTGDAKEVQRLKEIINERIGQKTLF